MNELTNRPSDAALVTAALFRGRTLGILVLGFIGGIFFWKWSLVRTFVWLASIIGAAMSVSRFVNDPEFVRQAARSVSLIDGPPGRLALGAGLSGPYLEGVERARRLHGEIAGEIRLLPAGPARAEFEDLSGRLEGFLDEVQRIASTGQKLELELSGGVRENVTGEILRLEDRIAGSTDPTEKRDLEQARANKESTLAHLERSDQARRKIQAQIEKIVSSLEEARARVGSLRATIVSDGSGAQAVQEALIGITNDVKYLSEGVEETRKLLIGD